MATAAHWAFSMQNSKGSTRSWLAYWYCFHSNNVCTTKLVLLKREKIDFVLVLSWVLSLVCLVFHLADTPAGCQDAPPRSLHSRCNAQTAVPDSCVRVGGRVRACLITAWPIPHLSPVISLAALLSLRSRFANTLHFCKVTGKNRSLAAQRIRLGWSGAGEENRPAVLIAAIDAVLRPTCAIRNQHLAEISLLAYSYLAVHYYTEMLQCLPLSPMLHSSPGCIY